MSGENIGILKNNCIEYAKSEKNIEVLKQANGKRHYTEISQLVGIHKTRVSGLLKRAEKFGLARKIKTGVYKKIPGVLGYMPSKIIKNSSEINTVQGVINKISKIRTKTAVKFFSTPHITSLPKNIGENLTKMSNAYCALYAVENILRVLIRKVLSHKVDWWKNFVPPQIQIDVSLIISKTPYHAVSRNDELEYTHLGQLKEIIIYGKNWDDFLPFLNEKDKSSFAVTINKAIPSRNAIGHCIPLKSKDLRIVDVRLQDILEMIK